MSQIERLPRLRRPVLTRAFQNAKDPTFVVMLVGIVFGMLVWAGFLGWLTYRAVRWAMGIGA